MARSALSLDQQKVLVANWGKAGRVLNARRRAELATQTRIAAFDMLQLGGLLPPDPARETTSGLIEMQRLFARGRTRGSS